MLADERPEATGYEPAATLRPSDFERRERSPPRMTARLIRTVLGHDVEKPLPPLDRAAYEAALRWIERKDAPLR